MTAYAIGNLRPPARVDEDVFVYMERIQSTLDSFGGRFLVHNQAVEIREGAWPEALVIIEFPAIEEARAWYASPAYQALIPLRTDHIAGDVVLVDGVGSDYDPGRTAAALRASAAA
ncbi:DUF1330 domain-containing protein [Streptomyces xanthochromogenes]|uniref:DUF1330 domain-containing protein n=1 Tax=Streptomyces xanthochromogenes TaxID=67384 RepID=UPI003420E0F5